MTAEQLKRLRQRAGLTQKALAALLGVARITVVRWETGQRPISRVTELAIRYVLERQRKRKGGR